MEQFLGFVLVKCSRTTNEKYVNVFAVILKVGASVGNTRFKKSVMIHQKTLTKNTFYRICIQVLTRWYYSTVVFIKLNIVSDVVLEYFIRLFNVEIFLYRLLFKVFCSCLSDCKQFY